MAYIIKGRVGNTTHYIADNPKGTGPITSTNPQEALVIQDHAVAQVGIIALKSMTRLADLCIEEVGG